MLALLRWDDAEIIGALRAWAETNGRTSAHGDWYVADANRPNSQTVLRHLRHFGTWKTALRRAGLKPLAALRPAPQHTMDRRRASGSSQPPTAHAPGRRPGTSVDSPQHSQPQVCRLNVRQRPLANAPGRQAAPRTSKPAELDHRDPVRHVWETCGTWGENPSTHAGLRQGQRLSKTGVAALGDDLDHCRDEPLAESVGVLKSPGATAPGVGLGVAGKALTQAVDLDPVPHDDALVFPPSSLSLIPLAPLTQHPVPHPKLWAARGKRRTDGDKFVKGA